MKIKLSTIIAWTLGITALLVSGVYLTTAAHCFLSGTSEGIHFYSWGESVQSLINNRSQQMMLLIYVVLIFAVVIMIVMDSKSTNFHSELYEVTPEIKIPKPCGQGQFGKAWWTTDKLFKSVYDQNILIASDPIVHYLISEGYSDLPKELRSKASEIRSNLEAIISERRLMAGRYNVTKAEPIFHSGGLVLGIEKKSTSSRQTIQFVGADTHALIIGATRCGKTRCLVIQTLVNLALSGENMVIADQKGELYSYLRPFLERLGYHVLVLDYKDMRKSMAYNLLQPVIDAFAKNDVNRAIQKARDITNILVGEKSANGEPIWHNGELSVIAACIVACVYDNMNQPENQNLTYVYEFLIRMCAERKGGMPLKEYLSVVGEEHPANILLAQANIAPEKTRGSFYTAAASTLQVWTDRELYHISNGSDFSLLDLAKPKTALFMILPEGKKSFYNVATLLIDQMYELLCDYVDIDLGTGRLPTRLNFVIDEFGNFVEMSRFSTKLSMAGGRGIRYMLFLQSFKQLNDVYGDNVAAVIMDNCETWVFLKSNTPSTKKEFVEQLDKYTISSYGMSSSKNSSGTSSMNLTGRDLLSVDDLSRLSRPYQLVIGDGGRIKKVTYSPDLSEWKMINAMLGLGNKKHNEAVRAHREKSRKVYHDVSRPIEFVNPIWHEY